MRHWQAQARPGQRTQNVGPWGNAMVVSLLTPLFLVAGAAIVVPILLHLRPQRKQIIIDFAAMRFLRPAVRRTTRRLKMQNLLLLAMRISVLALLALAFALPVVRSRGLWLLGMDQGTSLVVVLDNSYSMGCREGQRTRFDHAKQVAATLLAGLQEGDDGSLVLVSDSAEVVVAGLSPDRELLAGKLESAKLSWRTSDLRAGVDAALGLLRESAQPNRQVTVLSDLQESALDGLAARALEPEALEGIKLCVVNLGGDEPSNAAVADVRPVPTVGPQSGTLAVAAHVRNTGPSPIRTRISLVTDQRRLQRKALRLGARSEAVVQLRAQVEGPGPYRGRVELDPDQLAADNTRWFALDRGRRARVLCIDGEFARMDILRETFYLQAALAPGGPAEDPAEALPAVDVGPAKDLGARELDTYEVVILANVPDLPGLSVARLEKFVNTGGGLIVFVGDRVKADTYNPTLWGKGQGLLPARLCAPLGDANRRDQPVHLDRIDFKHPMLAGFGDGTLGDLRRPHFFRTYGVDADHLARGSVVLARYSDGRPAIVIKPYGLGRVVLVTSTCDLGWADLPLSPVFLPLVHQVIRHLSRPSVSAGRCLVGQPLRLPLDVTARDADVELETPSAEEHRLRPRAEGDQLVATFTGTHEPGIYRASVMEQGHRRHRWQPVNLDVRESVLRSASAEQVKALVGEGVEVSVARPDEVGEAILRARSGMKLWLVLLCLASAVFVAEALYAARLNARAGQSADGADLLRAQAAGIQETEHVTVS